MMMEKYRDFFLEAKPRPESVPEDNLGAALPLIPRDTAYAISKALVDRLKDDAGFRGALICEVREAWWQIRNRPGRPTGFKLLEAVHFIQSACGLFRWAGVEEHDLVMFNQCLSHGCTCDGCDLLDGARLERIIARVEGGAMFGEGNKTPACRARHRGRGRGDV
jgi:hypothetical protein